MLHCFYSTALYRDKIGTVAQGKVWDPQSASVRIKPVASVASFSLMTSQTDGSMHHSRSSGALSGGYQNGGNGYQDSGYQQFNTTEFKEQKENFFSKRQEENSKRPEYVYNSKKSKNSHNQ